jgi:hypothetical protein
MDRDMSGNDIACNGQNFCKVRQQQREQATANTTHHAA